MRRKIDKPFPRFSDEEFETFQRDTERMATSLAGSAASMPMTMLKKFWWIIPLSLIGLLGTVALVVWVVKFILGL